mgnify:FL=1
MKKYIYIVLSGLSLMGLTSCDSPLELYPLDTPSVETFYTNETELQGGVNACYVNLCTGSTAYLNYEYSWDELSDIMYHRGGGFVENVMTSSIDYTDSFFRTLWLGMYQGVARCNLILQKIDQINLDPAKTKQMRGELLFLRAFYYMRLVDMFGDVVYTQEPIPTIAEGMTVTRMSKAEVVKKIYKDLDESAECLKESKVKELGRATYGAALAYKSRVALCNSDWAIAKDAAQKVIDSHEYELYPSYGELFTESAVLSPANKEQIFTRCHLILAGNSTTFVRDAGCRGIGGWSTIVPTQNMIDSYECIDGNNIAESPLYDKLKPYENRDPRMRASLVLPGDMWQGLIFETRQDKPTTHNEKGEEVKNPESYSVTQYTTFTGYLLRKYFEQKYVDNPAKCEIPFMICRYAEVLLNYAEAKIELDEIDDSCLKALNDVRTRAGMPTFTASLGRDGLRKAVRHERKIELFNEGFRRNDLNRWKRSEVVLNRPIMGRPVLGEYEVYPDVSFDEWGDPVYAFETYAPHPSTDYRIVLRSSFKERDYLWPVPQTELNLNPNLGQNKGW